MTRAIVSFALLLIVAGPARAQDESGFVNYRHNLMESIGHDMGAIGDILKNGLPLQKNIAGHARSIADHSRLIAAAFEKNASGAPHDAKPNVWTDRAGFEKALADFQAEADRYAATAAGGDMAKIGAGTQALGKACNGCHETYRKPKEESYKRGKSDH
jgi:cytochrome c556